MTDAIFDVRENLQRIIDKLVEEEKILPSDAVRADLMLHLDKFGLYQGRFVELDTGISAEIAMRALVEQRPHLWPPTYGDEEEAAFGANPSLRARGDYLKKNGQAAYDAALIAWQANPSNLKPGVRPVAAKDQTSKAKPGHEGRDNPWLAPADDKQAMARRIEIINNPKLGPRVANALAKAAGVTLGCVPLRQ